MSATAVRNPFRAPTSCEVSHLEATHVSCDSCDTCEPWPAGRDVDEWVCGWCGDNAPVFEHHATSPLGFKDDKRCHWTGMKLGGVVIPESWIYYAKAPTP